MITCNSCLFQFGLNLQMTWDEQMRCCPRCGASHADWFVSYGQTREGYRRWFEILREKVEKQHERDR